MIIGNRRAAAMRGDRRAAAGWATVGSFCARRARHRDPSNPPLSGPACGARRPPATVASFCASDPPMVHSGASGCTEVHSGARNRSTGGCRHGQRFGIPSAARAGRRQRKRAGTARAGGRRAARPAGSSAGPAGCARRSGGGFVLHIQPPVMRASLARYGRTAARPYARRVPLYGRHLCTPVAVKKARQVSPLRRGAECPRLSSPPRCARVNAGAQRGSVESRRPEK